MAIAASYGRFFCFLLIIFFEGGAGAKISQIAWNLNDVSYLYPLPSKSELESLALLSPRTAGKKKQLLPLASFQRLPALNSGGSGQMTMYDHQLKVVGMRIDPCSNNHKIGVVCNAEVRLVWQPIIVDQFSNKVVTTDLAVHTFYRLSSGELSSLVDKLKMLKMDMAKFAVSTRMTPLSIHPGFANEKTRDLMLRRLNEIVLDSCGAENLYKMTFMSLLTANVWWRFGGFIFGKDRVWESIEIPRIKITSQDIFNSAIEEDPPILNPGTAMDAVINVLPPDYPDEDDLFPVINKGFRNNDESDRDIFFQKISAIDRFRNPRWTNPDTLDCATCHFADASRYYIGSRFSDLKGIASKFVFENPNKKIFNLENATIAASATRVVRAFGYFGDQPAVNQRVINDSAESAHWLNQNGF